MDIQKVIQEVIEKLGMDKGKLESFAKDPAATIKSLTSGLSEDEVQKVIEEVKGKVNLEDLAKMAESATSDAKGGLSDVIGKVEDIFKK